MGSTFSFSLPRAVDTEPVSEMPQSLTPIIADRLVAIEAQLASMVPTMTAPATASANGASSDSGEGGGTRGAIGESEAGAEARSMTLDILVVDDEPINRDVLRQQVEHLGHRVREASGGEEALESIRQFGKPDVMLLDVMMPRVSGLAVLDAVRARYDVASLPVLLLTAKAQEKDLVEGFAHGATDYILKPFAAAEVAARLTHQSRLLGALRAEREARRGGEALSVGLAQAEAQIVHFERLASLGASISGVAHDMMSPLHHIHSGAEILRARATLLAPFMGDTPAAEKALAEVVRFIGVVDQGCAAALSFTKTLRDSARADGAADEAANVGLVVVDVLALTHRKTATLEVVTEIAPDLVAQIPRSELMQVLMNLIGNSAEALVESGLAGAVIRVRAHGDGDRIHVLVEDAGPGIPQAIRDKIFAPFFTTKPPGKGTGLGLAVCRTVVKKAGGTLDVDASEDLGGARFTLSIPRRV